MNDHANRYFTVFLSLALIGLFVAVFGHRLFELPQSAYWAFGIVDGASILGVSHVLGICERSKPKPPETP